MNECHCNQYEDFNSRRDFLKKIAMGFGVIALSHIVPGKQFDFLGSIKSGQPIRSRKFEAKSKAGDLSFSKWRSIAGGLF